MRNLSLLFIAALLLISCDDGDIIITEFDFENQQLQHCGDQETQVLYNVNTGPVDEAIALIFSMDEAEFLENETEMVLNLNESNEIVFRTFDGEVGDYFCSDIPPSSPNVVEEYRSTSGGRVVFTPVLQNQSDHDGDGVPSSVEMEVQAEFSVDGYPDTDNDGIPNYLDIDDDNDNVRTENEIDLNSLETENLADGYPDTDDDGIPDYLDPDDDGDGVITRYEDLDRDGNPINNRNDEGLSDYLNPEIVDVWEVETLLPNQLTYSYRFHVDIEDLTLVRQGGDGENIRMETFNLGYYDAPSQTIDLLEELDGEDEEEEEEPGNGEEGEEEEGEGEGDTGAE